MRQREHKPGRRRKSTSSTWEVIPPKENAGRGNARYFKDKRIKVKTDDI